MCWCRVCERIATQTNLETLDVDGIRDADAALQHLAALSKLRRLSIAQARQLSTSALARLTALTALIVSAVDYWVGRCTSLLHAQTLNLAEDEQVEMSSTACFQRETRIYKMFPA